MILAGQHVMALPDTDTDTTRENITCNIINVLALISFGFCSFANIKIDFLLIMFSMYSRSIKLRSLLDFMTGNTSAIAHNSGDHSQFVSLSSYWFRGNTYLPLDDNSYLQLKDDI